VRKKKGKREIRYADSLKRKRGKKDHHYYSPVCQGEIAGKKGERSESKPYIYRY